MTDIAATFRKPFAEQVAAWRLRLSELRPTQTWTDVGPEFHDRGFMVAGAMKADLLADLAAAVEKAIAEGTSLDAFRRDFREIVARNGWTGWTGEGTKKGEAWRTRVIYRTNMATTYAAGRRAQLIAGNFAWWVYRHGGSLEPRIQHLGWNGLALPPDHPFWATHSPPNGWGCKCYVVGARTEAGIRRVGGNPGKTLPPGWDAADPRTGVPKGIDKGWAYAPGATVSEAVQALSLRLDALPDKPSIDLIQSWLRSSAFLNWYSAPAGTFPLARLSAADAAAIGSRQRTALLSAETVEKQKFNHPEIGAADYVAAQQVIELATHKVVQDARRMIFVLDEPGSGYVMVVKAVVEADELFIVSFYRLSTDDAKRDREIGRLLRKGLGASGGASPPA